MAGIVSFTKKYTWALIVLAISLIVMWFVLNFLHQKFGGDIVGRFAGRVGGLASGQSYQFG